MPDPSADNTAQIDYWNTSAGQTWAEFQIQLDRQIEPLGLEAMRILDPKAGDRILDIGCGCGQTSLQLAMRVGPTGAVLGADISLAMLEVARARPIPHTAAPLAFQQIDVQTGALGQAAFDLAFSRFGVMFFSDPVAAFVNIRRALKPGGRLAFVCWRPLAENLWMRAPIEAAAPFLPPAPLADPLAPGPFAFADAGRVRAILGEAGFRDIAITAFDAAIGGSNLEQTLKLSFRVGPLGSALREHPERRDEISDAVRAVLERYLTPNGVLMPAAVWIVQAETD